MKSIPMISGHEIDALSSDRKRFTWKPGVRKDAKTTVARRSRAQACRALRQGSQ